MNKTVCETRAWVRMRVSLVCMRGKGMSRASVWGWHTKVTDIHYLSLHEPTVLNTDDPPRSRGIYTGISSHLYIGLSISLSIFLFTSSSIRISIVIANRKYIICFSLSVNCATLYYRLQHMTKRFLTKAGRAPQRTCDVYKLISPSYSTEQNLYWEKMFPHTRI